MTNVLMPLAFILTIVPALWLLVGMLRTDWDARDNPGGRAVVYLLIVVLGTSAMSVSVVLLPDWAAESGAVWARVLARIAVASLMWHLLFLFWKAQRSHNRRGPHGN